MVAQNTLLKFNLYFLKKENSIFCSCCLCKQMPCTDLITCFTYTSWFELPFDIKHFSYHAGFGSDPIWNPESGSKCSIQSTIYRNSFFVVEKIRIIFSFLRGCSSGSKILINFEPSNNFYICFLIVHTYSSLYQRVSHPVSTLGKRSKIATKIWRKKIRFFQY